MKKVYLFIIMATFCMPVVFAQSIFRGKTVKSKELKLTYSVDENDNATSPLLRTQKSYKETFLLRKRS